MWSRAKTNPKITVNSGYPHPRLSGKIQKMNTHDYPNIPFKVYDGLGSSSYLPFRCSTANFTRDDVYTWQHNMPDDETATHINTMNMMNMQIQHQDYINKTYICDQGVGNSSCNSSFNDEYNSYKQNIFSKNSSFMAVNNCGSRIFSHGWGSQESTVDQVSGFSTGYVAA